MFKPHATYCWKGVRKRKKLNEFVTLKLKKYNSLLGAACKSYILRNKERGREEKERERERERERQRERERERQTDRQTDRQMQ